MAGELVQGSPKVIDANTLTIDGRPIVLYGILPIGPSRHCKVGRSELPCGPMAAAELGRIISGRPITCEVLQQDEWGRDIAQCFLDEQDLAGALIQLGLADGDPAAATAQRPEEGSDGTATLEPEDARGGPEVIVPPPEPVLPKVERPAAPAASTPARPSRGVTAPAAAPVPTF
jgi:hypothetical protein